MKIFSLSEILAFVSIVVTAAIPFIVVLWQRKKDPKQLIDAIKANEQLTNEIIPFYLKFNELFLNNEMAFLNKVTSDEYYTKIIFPFKVGSEELDKCSKIDMVNGCNLLNQAMLLFNKMDLFAAMILELNEDEQLYAKTLCRNAIIDIIHKYLGLFSILNFAKGEDYVSIRHLYAKWK